MIIAETQIDIITFLRFQIHFTSFKVFISKEFVRGRQAESLFVRKFHLKIFPYKIGICRSISKSACRIGQIDIVAYSIRILRYRSLVVLPVIFGKCRHIPSVRRHQTVRKPADVFTGDFRNRKVREFGRNTDGRAARTFKITDYMTESKRMRLSDMVIHLQRPIPVFIFRFTVLVRLFSPAAFFIKISTPVVSPRSGIDIIGDIMIIIGSQQQIQVFHQ